MADSTDTSVSPAEILLLGDPRLRERSREVERFDDAELLAACARLDATLEAFRREHGFGRAVSAPQIGVALRLIAVNLGAGTFFVVNPEVTWQSRETMTMWDDCMSFPGLLVRLSRYRSISLDYRDETGARHTWSAASENVSELLQHEIDHLDGVLAVDRALDRDALVMREVYEHRHEELAATVDYVIY
jgi:peptide deformylase